MVESEFRGLGLVFEVKVLAFGFQVQGLGFGVHNSRFSVQGLGGRV